MLEVASNPQIVHTKEKVSLNINRNQTYANFRNQLI